MNTTLVKGNKKRKITENVKTADLPIILKYVFYILTTLLSLSMLVPLLLTVSVSFTDNETLMLEGYKLIPTKWSLSAYEYLFKMSDQITRAYGITIFVTVFGTLFGLAIMTLFCYAVTRRSFPWKNEFVFFVYFTMLFGGGLIPTYVMTANILNLKDNVLALILPLCINASYILIMRTYMRTSVPDSIEEAAKIDGANEWVCFYKVILPMCIPVVATIALFLSINYWNDWYQGFLYIVKNDDIVPIQLMLKKIENNIEYLSNAAGKGMSAIEIEALSKKLPEESVKMALVVLVITPIMVAYPFFQKYFISGITIGAVKE